MGQIRNLSEKCADCPNNFQGYSFCIHNCTVPYEVLTNTEYTRFKLNSSSVYGTICKKETKNCHLKECVLKRWKDLRKEK